MKEKDWEQVKEFIRGEFDSRELVVLFDCPNCKHQTIATKWHLCSQRERRCLVCGKLFKLRSQTFYTEI